MNFTVVSNIRVRSFSLGFFSYIMHLYLILSLYAFFNAVLPNKDIVKPKKRGIKRGTNRFVSISDTITDVFFRYVHIKATLLLYILKKPGGYSV